jgi:hypothetical protein
MEIHTLLILCFWLPNLIHDQCYEACYAAKTSSIVSDTPSVEFEDLFLKFANAWEASFHTSELHVTRLLAGVGHVSVWS